MSSGEVDYIGQAGIFAVILIIMFLSHIFNMAKLYFLGAFLIPYCMFAVFCGFPMVFLEVSLGQFTRSGGFKAWNVVPLLKVSV